MSPEGVGTTFCQAIGLKTSWPFTVSVLRQNVERQCQLPNEIANLQLFTTHNFSTQHIV